MRFSVFLGVVVTALGLLAILAILRPRQTGGTDALRAVAEIALPAAMPQSSPSANGLTAESSLPPQPEVRLPANSTLARIPMAAEGERQAVASELAQKRVAELRELAMADDAASLETILSDLENPEPQIRGAALQASIQFASRDAIPRLQAVAARTDDPQAKRELEQAIDYLDLPSLTEVLEEKRQERAAAAK
jgi:hypothetical protein